MQFGDQAWFLGVFDSQCATDECKGEADNFEQLFLIWLGETMKKEGMGDDPEQENWFQADQNTSLETFKIA